MTTHFIVLITPEPIGKDLSRLWLDTASQYLPNGVQSSDDIIVNGHPKQSNFYLKKFGKYGGYVVPLTRDLSIDEAGIISVAFDKLFPEGDFTVDFSQSKQGKIIKKFVKEDIFNLIAEQVAKMLHSEWINTRVLEGWNYGPKKDRIQHKDPKLLPWEQVSESLKKSEVQKVYRTLSIMESIGFKITRR
jgi:ryanodine receptor 2